MYPGLKVGIDGEPTDMESAIHFARRDRHEFQHWALLRIGASPRFAATNPSKVMKGADEGYDGWMNEFSGWSRRKIYENTRPSEKRTCPSKGHSGFP
jgi:hypothetical protein